MGISPAMVMDNMMWYRVTVFVIFYDLRRVYNIYIPLYKQSG